MVIVLFLIYLVLRFTDTCPSCKRPLKRGSYTFYNWGAPAPGVNHYVQCRWCGFGVDGPQFHVAGELKNARERHDRLRGMCDAEKAARRMAQQEGVESDFIMWYLEKQKLLYRHDDLRDPFPEDKAPCTADVIAFLKERGRSPEELTKIFAEAMIRAGVELKEEAIVMIYRQMASDDPDVQQAMLDVLSFVQKSGK